MWLTCQGTVAFSGRWIRAGGQQLPAGLPIVFPSGLEEHCLLAKCPGNGSPFRWKEPKFSLMVTSSFTNENILRNEVAPGFTFRIWLRLVGSAFSPKSPVFITLDFHHSHEWNQAQFCLQKSLWDRRRQIIALLISFTDLKNFCFLKKLLLNMHKTWARQFFKAFMEKYQSSVMCPRTLSCCLFLRDHHFQLSCFFWYLPPYH